MTGPVAMQSLLTEDIVKNLVGIFVTGAVSFNTVILWSMRDMIKKHNQTLYGANGNNGHEADIKALRHRSHEHAQRLGLHDMALNIHPQLTNRGHASKEDAE